MIVQSRAKAQTSSITTNESTDRGMLLEQGATSRATSRWKPALGCGRPWQASAGGYFCSIDLDCLGPAKPSARSSVRKTRHIFNLVPSAPLHEIQAICTANIKSARHSPETRLLALMFYISIKNSDPPSLAQRSRTNSMRLVHGDAAVVGLGLAFKGKRSFTPRPPLAGTPQEEQTAVRSASSRRDVVPWQKSTKIRTRSSLISTERRFLHLRWDLP
jgi:hypothetical protein